MLSSYIWPSSLGNQEVTISRKAEPWWVRRRRFESALMSTRRTDTLSNAENNYQLLHLGKPSRTIQRPLSTPSSAMLGRGSLVIDFLSFMALASLQLALELVE